MERAIITLNEFIQANYVTDIRFFDIIEILIIAAFLYHIMLWVQNTKAWMLLKGILVIGIFILIAIFLNMQTILFIAKNSVNVLAIAGIVVFQPEIRRALENLGRKKILRTLTPFDKKKDVLKLKKLEMDAIMDACQVMSKECTGALIVIEQDVKLNEFIDTGIPMDCLISSQIILNIFEHNTPLHDGAIILRDDRIVASTCYLPLSENMRLDKMLGTRHRAAIGVSEVSDSVVIIVSEETGAISVAKNGKINTISGETGLRECLESYITLNQEVNEKSLISKLKGGERDEKNTPS